ncbi:hypothetical protein [Thermomonospora cellulosilytica]|uniref:Uncharacterized protein n=1 Tax=Thermomonospora cellulosilytica TaxID=1411118 RepID=A0A7W3RAI4_9ACTN|nr:hypothetical protein [Thermomonospora cellulosilytica]MBA9005897.1 hypothetical protein [Thermomonospora cellulosilytica]
MTYRLAKSDLDAKLGERSTTMRWSQIWYLSNRDRDPYADEVERALADITNNPYCPYR